MYEFLKLFFDICLLKKGPQDIPVSQWLLRLLIAIYAGISFFILVLNSDVFNTILQVIVELALILSSTAIILYIANKRSRYQQTASALMATDALISFFALPAMATLVVQSSDLAVITIFCLMLWHWVVSGHIFSQTLEQPFAFGLGVAFLYILVSYQVMALLFPEIIVAE
ncbi:MAG: hypothetical protein KAT04_14035 [Methylococcales bacterium]|nr:hypothetical protein [Methylococcales bacterium]